MFTKESTLKNFTNTRSRDQEEPEKNEMKLICFRKAFSIFQPTQRYPSIYFYTPKWKVKKQA